MYDVDGNGWIDLAEMTRIVVSIYKMMGDSAGPGGAEVRRVRRFKRLYTSQYIQERAAGIFQRMDVNNDGRVTRTEFIRTCLNDQKLLNLLTPNTE